MIKNISIPVLISIFLAGCSDTPKDLEEFMVPVSEFKIDDEVLKDGEYVEILGASGNLTSDHKHDFYNLIVVRSEKTGDTINVLSTSFFMLDENNSRTQFISNKSKIGKLFENGTELKDGETFDASKLKSKKFNRVLFDTEFIQVKVKNYPTVIGLVGGTIEGEENLEDLELLLLK